MQAGIQQREALVHFHAPDHSQTSLQQKALMQQGPLETALQSRRDQLMARTAELKTKARELDAALEVSYLSHTIHVYLQTTVGVLYYLLTRADCETR